MEPVDKLDALLSARLQGARSAPDAAEAPDELRPALGAADRIAGGRAIRPSPDFARTLEARLLERAAAARTAGAPIPAGATWRPGWPKGHPRWAHVPRSRRIQVAALAAALLLAIGAGLLFAAPSAPPASPLYGLRRLEQSLQVRAAASPADRVRLHVTYADQAMAALQDAARTSDGTEYRAALATLLAEDRAAASEAAALPPGEERARALGRVTDLRARERDALRAVLAALGWPDRIVTTSALSEIGVAVPSVAAAEVDREARTDGGGGQRLWRVTVSGRGFQPGAVLLVGGQQGGTVISVADGLLVAEVSGAPVPPRASIGVGNPDGTAASTEVVTRNDAGDPGSNGQPTPIATATHGNGNGGNPHAGTPTPHGHGLGNSKP